MDFPFKDGVYQRVLSHKIPFNHHFPMVFRCFPMVSHFSHCDFHRFLYIYPRRPMWSDQTFTECPRNNGYIVEKLLIFGAKAWVKSWPSGRSPYGYAEKHAETHQARGFTWIHQRWWWIIREIMHFYGLTSNNLPSIIMYYPLFTGRFCAGGFCGFSCGNTIGKLWKSMGNGCLMWLNMWFFMWFFMWFDNGW